MPAGFAALRADGVGAVRPPRLRLGYIGCGADHEDSCALEPRHRLRVEQTDVKTRDMRLRFDNRIELLRQRLPVRPRRFGRRDAEFGMYRREQLQDTGDLRFVHACRVQHEQIQVKRLLGQRADRGGLLHDAARR